MSDDFDEDLLKALGNPLRLRLLESIFERGEASPVMLAKELGRPLATVSRHFATLRDLGYIELTRTEPRRGAVEHFYRGVRLAMIEDHEWARLPVTLRRGLVRQTFRRIFAEAAEAGADGGFDRRCAHLDRVQLQLDDTGERELSDALHRLMREALEIQQRCEDRQAGDAGSRVPMRLALLLHEHVEPPRRTGGG